MWVLIMIIIIIISLKENGDHWVANNKEQILVVKDKKQINEELGSYVQETPQLELEQITKLPEQSNFYKVPRRFGSIPVDELPLGCDKKEQYYKIYPRISLPLQKVERIPFGHPELDPNHLFFSDNLHVMRMLPSESIDLIYIDPPFFSGRNYNVIFGDANEVRSFTDIWEGGMPGYLTWLNARLLEMKRLLKPNGSIYVHLDWYAVHYVKVEMDKIFGSGGISGKEAGFKNEISWCYKEREISKSRWNVKHDSILFYTKGKESTFNWDKVTTQYSPGSIKKYTLTDENGKKYQIRGKGGPYVGEQGLKPEIEKEYPEWTYRDYLDEKPGVLARDWWDDIPFINRAAKERVGYPTQKPEGLLNRIITASSNEGDIIADFFCGGGTTLVSAQRLGRRWIGCDISRIAVAITADRLTNTVMQSNNGGKQSIQQTIAPTPDISLEYWGIYEISSLSKLSDDEFKRFIVAAYNGRPASGDDTVHGYKEGIPLYVGSSSQEKPITKDQVIDFAITVLTKKGKNHGIMLGWAFAPSAQTAAAKLEEEKGISLEFVKISLVPIDSEEFRKHIISKHKEYSDLLIFILPPEVKVKYKRIAPMTYEFDISESMSLNSGGRIINVQWDFDHKGKFVSTQGYSFIRGDKNQPKLSVSYAFSNSGTKKIACKVQDDKGGERTETIEIEVK